MRAIGDIFVLAVVTAAGTAASSATGRAVASDEGREMEIIEQWRGQVSAQDERKRVVVRDSDSWQPLWHAMRGKTVPMPDLPAIDFQKHMVIGAFMGTRPTGGFSVHITRVVQNDKVVVTVREQGPAPGDMVTMALTSPYHVVVVPRSDKPVEFVADENGPELGGLRKSSRLPIPAPNRPDRSEP